MDIFAPQRQVCWSLRRVQIKSVLLALIVQKEHPYLCLVVLERTHHPQSSHLVQYVLQEIIALIHQIVLTSNARLDIIAPLEVHTKYCVPLEQHH